MGSRFGPCVRKPAVAGQFYSGTAAGLKDQVSQYITGGAPREKAIGILSPHAGLMYSGHVAGAVYSAVGFPETFVLLGPNHTGVGERVSIMSAGLWEIPTGTFAIDEALCGKIIQRTPVMSEDISAHLFEHSLELQLPFMAYFSADVKIVPVSLSSLSLEECRMTGEAIAGAIKDTDYGVTIVASSDMSHYLPEVTARKLDGLALKEVLGISPEGLYDVVGKERISMCGFIPAVIMLYAARFLGAKEARLVKYATSGDVSGDYDHVVGYAGVIIK